jgi:tungstate transport system ATP-binding protein
LRVQISSLSKKYDGRTVLSVDNLCFKQGRIHVIVGPNGSGKSTLLNIIAGLESIDGGTVLYGREGQKFNAVKGEITLVMQQPYLFNTTVYANIASGLRYRGVNKIDIQKMVAKAAVSVNLSSFLFRNALTLSGGEKQRVALARALVLEPKLLLLDESTANLDPESIGIMESVLKDFQRDTGATIIFVTHNIFQAKRLAHRVYLIMDGRVVEEGDRQKMFESPASKLTRDFLRGEIIY